MDKRLAECQRVIGYHFANPTLLTTALTHSSLRTDDKECNERLEFLGDAVLGLVISEELYNQLPEVDEGELTRHKSQVVARGALYRTSQNLDLARFVEVARGVKQRGALPVSVIANLVESVIGAIYLDSGFFPAREFIMRHMGEEMEETLAERGAKNHKSLLQHAVQQRVGSPPSYRTVVEEGRQHDKRFTVAAMVRGREWGRATGPTKKEAEQEAARKALEAWKHRGSRRRRKPRRDDAPEVLEVREAPEAREATEAREVPQAPEVPARGPAEPAAPPRRRRRRPSAPSAEKTPPKAPEPVQERRPEPRPEPQPEPAPASGGFAAGIDVPPAAPSPPAGRDEKADEPTTASVRHVDGRRTAPKTSGREPATTEEAEADEGFDAGL